MTQSDRVLAVVPARGGSKGLPGKNVRELCGLPLIAHSILLGAMCPEITRLVVSTDDDDIAANAEKHGGDVPFRRPDELAQDETPMWPVIQHALEWVEQDEDQKYDYVMLLDPTSPGRFPEDVKGALDKLRGFPDAAGIVGVSEPEFNPIWHSVVEEDGVIKNLIQDGTRFTRRQELPTVYRINAVLYIWRADFVRTAPNNWRDAGDHLMWEVPDVRAIHIDHLEDFQMAELVLEKGLVKFPWLTA